MPIRYTRGVYLPQRKEPAASRPIIELTEPGRVLLPLSYAAQQPIAPLVGDYESVSMGDLLAQPADSDHIALRSSVTGVVAGVRAVRHPLFGEMTCLAVDCVVAVAPEPSEHRDTAALTPEELRGIARDAGIVDELDGVPLHRKLADWARLPVGCLTVDAVEGESYSSSAFAVLKEYARQVKEGLLLAQRACGAQEVRISVRLPLQRVVELRRQLGRRLVYAVHDATYPYETIVPNKRHGSVCRIGTQACLALFRAAGYAEPQTSMVLTVAGDAVEKPQNVRVPIGTTAETVLRFCGLKGTPRLVVFGDCLSGAAADELSLPVLPGMTCLLAMQERPRVREQVCIGCGRCASACHAGLLPYEIVRQYETMNYHALDRLCPDECDACGACSYVCPAGREVTAQVLEAASAAGTVVWGGGDENG